jgi:hypothetical protein
MLWANYNGIPTQTITILQGIQAKLPVGAVVTTAHVANPFAFDTGGSTVFASGVNLNNFSARFESVYTPSATQDIIFQSSASDGFKLYIDGKMVFEQTRPTFGRFSTPNEYVLKAVQGRKYQLMIEFFKGERGNAILNFDMGYKQEVDYEGIAQTVADILFGDYNPAGRLPLTFYASSDQLPDFEDYNMAKGRTYRYFRGKPMYPFGHGLSYTTFLYEKADLNKSGIKPTESLSLTIGLKNTGQRDGDEVVQVYVRNLQDPTGPLKKTARIQTGTHKSRLHRIG